jgi:4-oxalocrotonate tautomerase
MIVAGHECVWFERRRRGGMDAGRQGADHRPQGSNVVPIVTVQQGPRSIELKRDLVRRITDAFVDTLQVPADSVQVWIQEVPADSWAVAGTLTAER